MIRTYGNPLRTSTRSLVYITLRVTTVKLSVSLDYRERLSSILEGSRRDIIDRLIII